MSPDRHTSSLFVLRSFFLTFFLSKEAKELDEFYKKLQPKNLQRDFENANDLNVVETKKLRGIDP